jgi:hypothetical protein
MTDIAAEQSDHRPAAEAADARVVSVSRDTTHKFSKVICKSITLLAGLGVEGDAHMGVTVKHRSRVRRDPSQPNLRQVHLIHAELVDALQSQGFAVSAGAIGENITTRGIDLLGLLRGTQLRIGATAVVEVTGLRNPCYQLNTFQPGLMAAVLGRDAQPHSQGRRHGDRFGRGYRARERSHLRHPSGGAASSARAGLIPQAGTGPKRRMCYRDRRMFHLGL